ncbi:MAG: hypothetical protein HQM02_02965 [Magnetococcales bacterium]|nr:hypothetical protein [Magnetococcales bacterium]
MFDTLKHGASLVAIPAVEPGRPDGNTLPNSDPFCQVLVHLAPKKSALFHCVPHSDEKGFVGALPGKRGALFASAVRAYARLCEFHAYFVLWIEEGKVKIGLNVHFPLDRGAAK